ncbi:hypothetical protein BG004_003918 [Podila humilis]|nr:hypothetical protein BG004_003918 [Podila humilis]
MAIHANVVYRMCIRCSSNNENVAGWEIGTVQSNGRFVKVKSTGNPQWIDSIRPDRMFKFYGQFTVVDGEHIYSQLRNKKIIAGKII